jgi:hypothetical protein
LGRTMPAGRSNDESLRADPSGRVTPQTQEQDPRRDVSGCNRKSKERLRSNPTKNRNQSTEQRVPSRQHVVHSITVYPMAKCLLTRTSARARQRGTPLAPLPSHRPSQRGAQGRCDGDGGGAHRDPWGTGFIHLQPRSDARKLPRHHSQ